MTLVIWWVAGGRELPVRLTVTQLLIIGWLFDEADAPV
jgi:hypothetical protein